jgi:predicted alpha/beta hydrolase family esterase
MTQFLLLPGWHDSGPGHWQSRWPVLHDGDHFLKVDQDDWAWPKRGDWMMNLDQALLADPAFASKPAILVAHSLGCHLVAAWAAHSQHTRRVKGAWLVAPPDLDGPEATPASLAPQLHGWCAVVRKRLPFPAMVLASRTDAYAGFARSQALAADWGASLRDLGDAGHVNEVSGHGDWPEGWQALKEDVAGW